MRVVVYHAAYGCDTGCCGHVIEMDDGREHFVMAHPFFIGRLPDDPLKWAQEQVKEAFGAEHVADLDWDASYISDG